MDELSAVYSNVNRESLTYNGKVYDHLLDVVKAQVKDLKEQLNLQDSCLPKDEKGFTVEALENGIVRREEQKEERQLLNSGESKLSGSLSDWGISFERIKVPLMITDMTIDLDKLVPRFAELGISVKKMAVEAWGGTRTKNIPDVTVLGAFLPVLEPIIRVGEPILYEKYKIYSEGGLLLASPSTTFEFWTRLMPIFHTILFCGSLAGGDLNDGKEIRRGFVHGILPPGPNGVGVKQAYNYFLEIADEIWKRGTCVEDWKDQGWEQWSRQFDPRSRCKVSVVRDLVRIAKIGGNVAMQVSDIETAAVAFGLAQVKLCRIEVLNFGRGPRIYGLREAGFKALKLKSSKVEKHFFTYRYINRKSVFNLCGVPAEFEEDLMRWLDDEIAKTIFLGIENGDPPGTVIMTPSFCMLAETGAIKSLGSLVKRIAKGIAEKCEVCGGKCTYRLHVMFSHFDFGCRVELFLNALVSIYVAGVLLKGGMVIDQCTLCGDLKRTWKSLNRLFQECDYGLGAFLASWYILRTGEDAPHVDDGSVLGIEMDGKVHGLRYAVKPGTTGSVLVSFNGHIHYGSHVSACLVFEEPDQFHHELKAAKVTQVTEQPPDVIPQQVLFIRSEPNYIAVNTFLVYPNGDQLQVGLGSWNPGGNKHRCIEATEDLAVPINVSQCADGLSTVKLFEDFKHVLHTYDNESLQSWISGAFPREKVWFQGCRPLNNALALVRPGGILIEGSRQTYRAIAN
ncbi:hypothetical protein G6F16_011267 [Rhizopus arrhizus]|nr:hypothetical protein G6F16_011267 [Rhizopus arrhizus]KAG0895230.1 hypothetical protein G6F34_008418 [Rhizopus arrhizus]KAG1003226.1 hypothetical protein G6F27_011242 [Rhizopus arrhizus]KAG1037985.1 hypothetical protein G6F25_006759 [Rhizopus arrhizus]KAG1068829.1 hypothetical protein G6F41_006515 [Rhizopus arrhizus]